MGRRSTNWKIRARTVKRAEVKGSDAPRLSQGYWDRLIQRLIRLPDDAAIELTIPLDSAFSGYRSSLTTAAARAGVRLRLAERIPLLFAWISKRGELHTQQALPHYIDCRVCGKPIRQKPKTKRQYVHAGRGNVKSKCQQIWRIARENDLSVEEATHRWEERAKRRRRIKRMQSRQRRASTNERLKGEQ